VQRELRELPGVTVLVYDQTCASEKRRRRKKIVDGKPGYPDPARRVVINEAVCEGCGDCSVQSSCVSVEPLETEFGRKRRINQSSCNKDYSCLKGFCPSFVTVEGGELRKGAGAGAATAGAATGSGAAYREDVGATGSDGTDGKPRAAEDPAAGVPEPARFVALDQSGTPVYGVMVTGVGGTGVVTIGQLLGMAAHLEGKGISVLDMAGLAQKGGAVFSHVQIAQRQDQLYSTRIATGEADLVIGCDLVVTAGNEALSKMRSRVTRGVINGNVSPTSDFIRDPDWQMPAEALKRNVLDAAGDEDVDFIDANDIAVTLLGDTIYTNPLLLGYAWQKGWLPLTREALERAIELNGVSVAANLRAFRWGRRIAHEPELARTLARPAQTKVIEFKRPVGQVRSDSDLQELIERRVAFLTDYQNAAYAKRYREWVERVRRVEGDRMGVAGRWKLTEAVARYLFKLMAYKDEYEVARLHADPAFVERIRAQFTGDYKLKFHLAPPIISRINPDTGRPAKREFGPWMLPAFRVLAKMKFLRGTALDPFGRTEERRTERQLIVDYEALLDELLSRLCPANHALAVDLARIPEHIRGYGPVKERHLHEARRQWDELLARFRMDGAPGKGGKEAIPIRVGY
jgi:indolepyruvate ferredoxin oxidoreductase